MNKNLKTEYKDLIEQETSKIDVDALWNRIDAALPEKDAVNPEESKTNIKEFKSKRKWYASPAFISITTTAVAACALIMIAVSGGFSRNAAPAAVTSTNIVLNTDEAPAMNEAPAMSDEASEWVAEAEEAYAEAEEVTIESEKNAAEAGGSPADKKETSESIREDYKNNDSFEAATQEFTGQIEFDISAESDEFFICQSVISNNCINQDEVFYLDKASLGNIRDSVKVTESYILDLIYQGTLEENGVKIKVFSYKK